ncbi:Cro/CI family transcriptional regulator [Marinagarivorans algicola]|uniref:Cro/CI family transcriptional regulator n=1 Tax=Marinagarivorans algicola TaxID=1513270 RepID=UPI0009E6A64B|nr:Cro/CI family transcriptional regulator [Marinagarivorans algicola]
MTKASAIEHFGSVKALAKALKITTNAVSQWGDDVPKLREYQLKEVMNNNELGEEGDE